jgi:hypothetical protein
LTLLLNDDFIAIAIIPKPTLKLSSFMSSYQLYAEKVYTGNSVLNNQLISVENGFISSMESSGFVEGALRIQNISAGLFDVFILLKKQMKKPLMIFMRQVKLWEQHTFCPH